MKALRRSDKTWPESQNKVFSPKQSSLVQTAYLGKSKVCASLLRVPRHCVGESKLLWGKTLPGNVLRINQYRQLQSRAQAPALALVYFPVQSAGTRVAPEVSRFACTLQMWAHTWQCFAMRWACSACILSGLCLILPPLRAESKPCDHASMLLWLHNSAEFQGLLLSAQSWAKVLPKLGAHNIWYLGPKGHRKYFLCHPEHQFAAMAKFTWVNKLSRNSSPWGRV